jgi:hypothetical protein
MGSTMEPFLFLLNKFLIEERLDFLSSFLAEGL